MSLFGPLSPSLTIEKAAHNTLVKWMPTYLAEVADQYGLPRGSLVLPQSYPTASQFGRTEDQVPAIGIHCPGIASVPVKEADGTYRVEWSLEIGALVAANDEVNTDHLAKLYAAAIWGCIMQHRSLGEVAEHLEWPADGERYDVLEPAQTRALAFCLLRFNVTLKNARGSYGGPSQPLTPAETDHGDWPDVERVNIDLTALP